MLPVRFDGDVRHAPAAHSVFLRSFSLRIKVGKEMRSSTAKSIPAESCVTENRFIPSAWVHVLVCLDQTVNSLLICLCGSNTNNEDNEPIGNIHMK